MQEEDDADTKMILLFFLHALFDTGTTRYHSRGVTALTAFCSTISGRKSQTLCHGYGNGDVTEIP